MKIVSDDVEYDFTIFQIHFQTPSDAQMYIDKIGYHTYIEQMGDEWYIVISVPNDEEEFIDMIYEDEEDWNKIKNRGRKIEKLFGGLK